MIILIQSLAWLIFAIGLLSGMATVLVIGSLVFRESGNVFLLVFLPLLSIGSIRISRRFLQKRDFQSARAVAAMSGFAAWILLRSVTRPLEFEAIHFIGPILFGIAIYYFLMLGIWRTFPDSQEQNKSGEGTA